MRIKQAKLTLPALGWVPFVKVSSTQALEYGGGAVQACSPPDFAVDMLRRDDLRRIASVLYLPSKLSEGLWVESHVGSTSYQSCFFSGELEQARVRADVAGLPGTKPALE
jgi:hypothetical protein